VIFGNAYVYTTVVVFRRMELIFCFEKENCVGLRIAQGISQRVMITLIKSGYYACSVCEGSGFFLIS
jgi:hypothetical protein